MTWTLIPARERQAAAWAGGTTEQLFIWPPSARYGDRDFALRVSTATVALAETDFTPLPGFTRWIMPLSGRMALTHQGRGGAALAPGEVHRFEGGWHTRSEGLCTDFNLMLAAGWEGSVAAAPGAYACPAGGFAGVYAFAGPLRVRVVAGGSAREAALAPGDLLAAHGPAQISFEPGQPPGAVFTAWPRI